MSSGMERTPQVFSRPVWKDPFFWVLVVTVLFWIAVFRLVF